MRRATFATALVVLLALACTDEPAPVAVEDPVAHRATASLSPCDRGLATHIRNQIATLFPKGKSLRQAAQSQFDNIERKCRSARAEAQAKALEFVAFTIAKHQNRQLTSAATPAAVADFLADVLAYVDLDSEGAVTVVQPSTSEQTVATADRQAGASFPPGAVSQPVVVVIAPSADQTDPLPTGLTQFPPFYDFVTSPAITFEEPVTIGICVNHGNASQEVLDRLRLARPDVTGGTTLELLPRVAAPFLDCPPLPGLTTATGPVAEGAGWFVRLVAAASAVVRPARLHAAGLGLVQFDEIGGLGGTVGNFGDNPTGAVDSGSGLPDLVVTALTRQPEVPTERSLVTFTAAVTNIGTASAPPSTLIYAVGISAGVQNMEVYALPALAPAETVFVVRQEVIGVSGVNFADSAFVDMEDAVAELSEANNQATTPYYVVDTAAGPLSGTTAPTTVPPVVDGILTPGEWSNAQCHVFQANAPGGGTTRAFVCVMNDLTNLYLAVRHVAADSGNTAMFEFDNDDDGGWPEDGDDAFQVSTRGDFAQFSDFFRASSVGCPGCLRGDVDEGGTSDGVGSFGSLTTPSALFNVFEASRPLNSADDAHDFSLAAAQLFGMFLQLELTSKDLGGGFITFVPGPGGGTFLELQVHP